MLFLAVLLIASVIYPYQQLGSEFMPPLWEGDLLYMPTTLPGISVTKARELLQQTDRIIAKFPEVHHVFGKVGRAETATDPGRVADIQTRLADIDAWSAEARHVTKVKLQFFKLKLTGIYF